MNSINEQTVNSLSTKVVESLTTCVEENKGRTLQLMDGSVVRLTPIQARRFIEIHDNLEESNKTSFRLMLIESKKTFEGVMTFCKERQ